MRLMDMLRCFLCTFAIKSGAFVLFDRGAKHWHGWQLHAREVGREGAEPASIQIGASRKMAALAEIHIAVGSGRLAMSRGQSPLLCCSSLLVTELDGQPAPLSTQRMLNAWHA